MINSVPVAITNAARAVALKHPNALDCSLYRKVIDRVADDGSTEGGLPTIGGLGVLTPEDEPTFEYKPLGEGRLLITSQFQGTLDLTDRGDALAPDTQLLEALVEPIDVPGFQVKKYDLIAAMPGGGVVIAYEVVGMVSAVGISPYSKKWILAPRDELSDTTPWESE
ncbi:hypothetical protein [Paraburkholderia sp. C35]|uniref:hypothetical protein n=1 Tax=Paraburkholderia sp. C35 TaxID=2126993 RepID=UPI000D691FFD|nr:hypothetical protein [Paraburkholderia sp. C35]